jgi:hypothetical protein
MLIFSTISWAHANRQYNRWFGPSRGVDVIGGKSNIILPRTWFGDQSDMWTNLNWGDQNPGERIFYVTHDRGKVRNFV